MYDWPRIVEEHGPAVYRIARRILGHAADAEDVCQEVFWEASRMAAHGSVANLPGLVRRLAALRALDRLRSRKPMVPLDDSVVFSRHDGPAEVAIANELTGRLRQSLAELPEQQAAAFSLRYFEHLTNMEIAECLETTTGAVSTALSKARDALSGMLGISNSEE